MTPVIVCGATSGTPVHGPKEKGAAGIEMGTVARGVSADAGASAGANTDAAGASAGAAGEEQSLEALEQWVLDVQMQEERNPTPEEGGQVAQVRDTQTGGARSLFLFST